MTEDRATGLDAREIVGAYIRRFGWARAVHGDDLDDLWGRLLLTCVHALRTYDPGGGRNRVSWCWWHLHRDAARWWAKHLEWRAMSRDPVEWEKGWWAPGRWQHERGFDQVEDRDQLQRLADRAGLTRLQAEAVAWFAVHKDTPTRHLGGHDVWFPGVPYRAWQPSWQLAVKKMRRAAGAGVG